MDYPAVTKSLENCAVPAITVTSGIRGVQSCVSSAGHRHGSFFTKFTLEKVREAIADSQDFKSSSSFDPWGGICSGDYSKFVGALLWFVRCPFEESERKVLSSTSW